MAFIFTHYNQTLAEMKPHQEGRLIIKLNQTPRYSADNKLMNGNQTLKSLQDYKTVAITFKHVLLSKQLVENKNTYRVPIAICLTNCVFIVAMNVFFIVNNYSLVVLDMILFPLFCIYFIVALHNIEKLIKSTQTQQPKMLQV